MVYKVFKRNYLPGLYLAVWSEFWKSAGIHIVNIVETIIQENILKNVSPALLKIVFLKLLVHCIALCCKTIGVIWTQVYVMYSIKCCLPI